MLPGLGQVQIKLGDFKSALSNFEKVLEVYPDNCETLKVSVSNRKKFYICPSPPPLFASFLFLGLECFCRSNLRVI